MLHNLKQLILLGALSLLVSCHQAHQSSPLADRLEQAVDGSMLSSDLALFSFESRPFIVTPNARGGPGKSVRVSPEHGLEVRFLCNTLAPTTLTLQGFTPETEELVNVKVELNGSFLGSVTFRPESQTFRFELESSQLRTGENKVSFSCDKPCFLQKTFAKYRYRPSTPRAPQEGLVDHRGESFQTLFLPYSHPLEFPYTLGESQSFFRIENVLEWNEIGSPNALTQPKLQIRIFSDEPPFEESRTLAPQQSLELSLPADLKQVVIRMAAEPGESPIVGQNGLRVVGPRVESSQAESPPSPEPKASVGTGAKREVSPAIQAEQAPNVVLYLVDTLRADHLGAYGYERQTSPHFDALAQDSVLFEDVSAQSPWTKPSTATILTGLHPRVHGAVDFGDILNPRVTTVGEVLAQQGYECQAITANVFASGVYKITQGFATYFLPMRTSHDLHERAIEWLDGRDTQKPFFLYLHSIDPHAPYAPAKEFNKWSERDSLPKGSLRRVINKTQRESPYQVAMEPEELQDMVDLYDGEVLSNDKALGNLVAELKQRNLYDNTLILVISDHGEQFFEHQGFGHVSNLYQELLRIPWIVKYPQQQAAGTRVKGNWQQLDVAPTLLKACGLEVPELMTGLAFDPGEPQAPFDRPLFFHVHVGPDAKKTRQALEPYDLHMEGLRIANYCYIETHSHRRSLPVRALFDLQADPKQLDSLLSKKPATTVFLRSRLQELQTLKPLSPVKNVPPSLMNEHLKSLQYLR